MKGSHIQDRLKVNELFTREVTIEDKVFLVPFFTVRDLHRGLGLSPTTIRTWVQWEWLDAYRGDNGYIISWMGLAEFFEKHRGRLKSLNPQVIDDFMTTWQPEDITEEKRREEEEKRQYETRKAGYFAYAKWVEQTYSTRKKLGIKQHGDDWIRDDLIAIPDSRVAEISKVPIPPGSLEAVQQTTEERDGLRLPNSFEFNPQGYAQFGVTTDSIKHSILWDCISKELGWEEANRRCKT